LLTFHIYKEIFKESSLYKHIHFTNALITYAFSNKKLLSTGYKLEFTDENDVIFTSAFTLPEYKNKRKFLTPILKDIYKNLKQESASAGNILKLWHCGL